MGVGYMLGQPVEHGLYSHARITPGASFYILPYPAEKKMRPRFGGATRFANQAVEYQECAHCGYERSAKVSDVLCKLSSDLKLLLA
jgi:hypothetical protein